MAPIGADRHAAYENAVVVDAGGHSFKAGLAAAFPASAEPRVVTSSTLRDAATPSAPPRRACVDGAVADWDALEALLARTLYADCGWLAGEEGCLLTVEPVATPRRDRERWAQLAFEAFNVAGFFALDAPVAALYAVGRPSGTVIDVGHDKTDVAVVLDGGVVPGSVTRMASGGAAAEALLAARLAGRGVDVGGLDPVALRAAKQAVAAVRPSREAALADMAGGSEPAAAHTLPDGTPLPPLTPADGVAAGECLASPADAASVRPALAGQDCLAEVALAAVAAAGGEAAAVSSTSSSTTLAARRSAAEAFVLVGGGSRVPGLGARLAADVRASLPAWCSSPPAWPEAPSYLPPDSAGPLAAWSGGAIAARVVFVQNQHASRADYDEMGPVAIFRRGACG